MKKTILAIALAIGIATAQADSTITISQTNVPVVTLAPSVTLVAVTNLVRVTNNVPRVVVTCIDLTEAQVDGFIQLAQSQGVSASRQIHARDIAALTITQKGGTNGVPITFTPNIRIK